MNAVAAQDQWPQYEQLVVTLKPQVDTVLQSCRGEDWTVLRDRINCKHMRINASAAEIIRLMDGYRNLKSICQLMGGEQSDQKNIISLVSELMAANLLSNCGKLHLQQAAFNRLHTALARKAKRRAFNPLAIRLPLFNPAQLLDRTLHCAAPLFSRWALCVLGLVLALAGMTALNHADSILAQLNSDLIKPYNLGIMLAVYVVMKLVHEASHAYVLRYLGGEVKEVGITLLVLMPIPYVEASDTWAIPGKKARVAVSLAGILSELVLASIALFVWLNVGSGVLSDIAFNTLLVGTVSTLLFNANPLLKFDGYYVLQDILELPNLASRSNRRWMAIIKRMFCNIRSNPHNPANPHAKGEGAVWLLSYAPLALAYRMTLLVVITQFLVEHFLFIGVLLACWAIYTQIAIPAIRTIRFVALDDSVKAHRKSAIGKLVLTTNAILLLLFAIPVPQNSHTQGIVWVSQNAELFQQQEGFLEKILVQPGSYVEAGTALLQFHNTELEAQWQIKQAELAEHKARLKRGSFSERVAYNKSKRAIEALQFEIDQLNQQRQSLIVYSDIAGQFFLEDPDLTTGMYIERGKRLGYIRNDNELVVRSVVAQHAIPLLEQGVEWVEFRMAQQPSQTFRADIHYASLEGSTRLPSAALGAPGGGQISVQQDKDGLTAGENYFAIELKAFDGLGADIGLGGRVFVKFQHGLEPLGLQWWRRGVQLMASDSII